MRRLLAALSLLATLAACQFDAGGPPAVDATVARWETRASELRVDSCVRASAPRAAGEIAARRVVGQPPVIDGTLAEWACLPFAELTPQNAHVTNISGLPVAIAARFALQWDTDNLYIAVRVVDPTVEGAHSDIARNDGIELFLDGDGELLGDYGPDSHHYVIDHRGQKQDDAPSSPAASAPELEVVTRRTPLVGYDVEARVPATHLVPASKKLIAGYRLGFDLAINDGDGQSVAPPVTLLWHLATASCGCKNCCTTAACCCGLAPPGDQPWCNTLRFGIAILAAD